MITKISKEGWEQAYYGKWVKAQERTRKKRKWDKKDYSWFSGELYRVGWSGLEVVSVCSYCIEVHAETMSFRWVELEIRRF